MGCFNARCFVTNLPITYNDEIVAFFVHDRNSSPSDFFTKWNYLPIPFFGNYDHYGSFKEKKPNNKRYKIISNVINQGQNDDSVVIISNAKDMCRNIRYNNFYNFGVAMMHKKIYTDFTNINGPYIHVWNKYIKRTYSNFLEIIQEYEKSQHDASFKTYINSLKKSGETTLPFNEDSFVTTAYEKLLSDTAKKLYNDTSSSTLDLIEIVRRQFQYNINFSILSAYRHGLITVDEAFNMALMYITFSNVRKYPEPSNTSDQQPINEWHINLNEVSKNIIKNKLKG